MSSGERLAAAGGQDQNAPTPASGSVFVPRPQPFQRPPLVESRFHPLLMLAKDGQIVFSIKLARRLGFFHEVPTVECNAQPVVPRWPQAGASIRGLRLTLPSRKVTVNDFPALM